MIVHDVPVYEVPVPYAVLLEQITAAANLLEELRAEPPSSEWNRAIDQVEEARGAMFDALAACEPHADRTS